MGKLESLDQNTFQKLKEYKIKKQDLRKIIGGFLDCRAKSSDTRVTRSVGDVLLSIAYDCDVTCGGKLTKSYDGTCAVNNINIK